MLANRVKQGKARVRLLVLTVLLPAPGSSILLQHLVRLGH